MRRFQFFGGRRYLTQAPYLLPSDEQEINRLDFQHYLLRYVMRGNFAAPLRHPQDILDVGSGSGRWPLEMAMQFPQANVIEVDLAGSPKEADTRLEHRPDNYVFVAGNVLEGLAFASASFDFVHQRLLMSAIPASQWPSVVRELVRVARPAGWVEASPVEGAPALNLLKTWQVQLTGMRGIDILIGSKIHTFLEASGLQQVTRQPLPVPFGPHGGRLGVMAETNYFAIMETLRGPLAATGIVAGQTFDETVQAARAETAQGRLINMFYVAYGQVPAPSRP